MEKAWKCPNGHTLGVARREKIGGRWLTRLALYREAVDETANDGDSPSAPDVIAIVDGAAIDVQCSICGATRTWSVGQDALEHLLDVFYRAHRERSNLEPHVQAKQAAERDLT